jgi:hypothetical protein
MEKQFIDQISSALGFFTETQNGYKFQCPYCQRGSKDHKGRAMSLGRVNGSLYRINDRNDWKYRCFHCGEHKSFHHFLEDHFPEQFVAYVRQRDALGTTGKHTNCPKLETVLKEQGLLPKHPPRFHDPSREQKPSQTPLEAPAKPLDDGIEPKITKLPAMRSRQQQAGYQAKICSRPLQWWKFPEASAPA